MCPDPYEQCVLMTFDFSSVPMQYIKSLRSVLLGLDHRFDGRIRGRNVTWINAFTNMIEDGTISDSMQSINVH
jgi:hypothetical protein